MRKKITVIGGGTGTSTVLSGLKQYNDIALTAVVVVSDNGGSTGRLRDEFGFLPAGDMRQCIAALARGKNEQQIRDLLLYRFKSGEGLKGHNLGNLILTALSDISDTPSQAVEYASKIFAIKGRVYPITESLIDLVIEYNGEETKVGEKHLDDLDLGGRSITNLSITPEAKIYEKAARAIAESDVVILGPGDLYGSLLPSTLVDGFAEALKQAKQFVYIVNLMTHFSQTHEMTAQDHLDEVVRYSKRAPDVVIINTGTISQNILQQYTDNKEFPVTDDLQDTEHMRIVRGDYVSRVAVTQKAEDAVQRSVLRHDVQKLATELRKHF